MVARYGGEEFAIILPETNKAIAYAIAQRIRQRVREIAFEGEKTQPQGILTISIGVASFPEDATSKDDLIKRADEALYLAKESGRDRVCLSDN